MLIGVSRTAKQTIRHATTRAALLVEPEDGAMVLTVYLSRAGKRGAGKYAEVLHRGTQLPKVYADDSLGCVYQKRIGSK